MVRYRWKLLRAGTFRLDGGSMFGLIPRAVWSRQSPPDDKGRIGVQHNCLLLERADDPPSGAFSPQHILIEAGTGDKLDEKSRAIFDFENRSIIDALHEADRDPADIGATVTSHLHFDHAGGLTRLCRPNETPDWSGPASNFGTPRPDHGVKLTFPNAVHFTQRREWEDALANRSVMTRTYFRDHLEPLAPHIRLVDSPPPFTPGLIPERDAMPCLPQYVRETEIMPGIYVFRVPGHTWGQQAIRFIDTDSRSIVFTPDVMPTSKHLGAAYSLGYDVEPYTSMVSRHWFLATAAAERWTLVLDHEPDHAVFTVQPSAKGWFELIQA